MLKYTVLYKMSKLTITELGSLIWIWYEYETANLPWGEIQQFYFRYLKLLLCDRGAANSKFTLLFAYMQCFPDVVKHMDLDECKEHPEVCLYFHAQLQRVHQPVPDLEF